jgi:uncharacterized protein YndB with AHSA1/START domain
MWKKILLSFVALCAIIVLFVIYVSVQPSDFSVERSTTIAAPPAAVFDSVNDLQKWDAWSPWKDLDPNAKSTISAPSAGNGASFTWDGNEQIGAGSLTIVESEPNESVDVDQEFIRPFAGKARMAFRFASVPNGLAEPDTKVTWKLSGTNDFFGKLMCLFTDMDAVLGKGFERGLATMKSALEKKTVEPTQSPSPPQ